MNRMAFFLRYALNGLRRGGQRVFIAVLAVAFGVMSLIVMTSVADAISRTLTDDPRLELGGDLRLTQADGTFDATSLALLSQLQSENVIDAYSSVSVIGFPLLRTETSGRARFVQRVIGIDPTVYPLVGDWALVDDVRSDPAALLRENGAALITRDLAARYSINTGDVLRLAENDGDILAGSLTVAGILADTPDHMGSRIVVNLATVETMHGDALFDYVIATTDDSAAASARLTESGWQVARADQQTTTPSDSAAFFDLMLRGAGILGLMVGGIGISNTMQVLLARRREEIGVLKTLGYSSTDMTVIFMIEAGLLGLLGGVLGSAVALLLSRGLTMLFANITTLLVTPALDSALLLGGLLVGVVTTIIFAGYAILRASRVRPTAIFRHESVQTSWRSVLAALGFYVLLAIPFAAVTSLVLGSVIEGVGILLFALVGLIVLGLILGGGTWGVLRLLPVFRFNLLRMARNNMRKRAFSMLFAMIALFSGVFALGFAATVIQNSFEQLAQRQTDDSGANLLVYSASDSTAQIVQLLEEVGSETINLRYRTPITLAGQGLEARDSAWDIEIIEGEAFVAGGLYVWEDSPLTIGSTVTITLPDGDTQSMTVNGRYRNLASDFMPPVTVPIMHTAALTALNSQAIQTHIFARVDVPQQDAIAFQIGAALPDVITLTQHDVNAQIQSMFRNLFAFALALSALALLAGAMLIANVVSLALIERHYEIGIMKAVGYTRRHVLITLLLEYGLVGFIASVVGLIGVQIAIALITVTQSAAEGVLWLSPMTALIVLAVGVGLTLVTALLAAWEPTRVRPMVMLNARE